MYLFIILLAASTIGAVVCQVKLNLSLLDNVFNETSSNQTYDLKTTVLHTNISTEEESNFTTLNEEILKISSTRKTRMEEATTVLPTTTNVPCACDLLVDTCDINCCCDESCTAEDKSVFTHCEVPVHHVDENLCFEEDFIYVNNTPYVMTKISQNMFCVYTDNNKVRFLYKDVHPITTGEAFQSVINQHQTFTWGNQYDRVLNYELKVNSPIEILYDNRVSGYLSLLNELVTGSCVGGNPAAFMKDVQNECHHRIGDLRKECVENIYLSGHSYFKNFSLVRVPNVNNTEDSLVPVVPQLCVFVGGTSIRRCVMVENLDEFPMPIFNFSTNICEHAVTDVFYHLFHNGTQGIVAATVDISVANISWFDGDFIYWKQKHAIDFKKVSDNANISSQDYFRASGNPGYLLGAPVLAGKLITTEISDGTKDDELLKAVNLNSDPKKWLTVVHASEGGYCGSNTVTRIPVTFRNDINTGCILDVSLENVTGESCALLQSTVLDVLIGWNPPDVVGVYGNSRPDRSSQWVPILNEGRPPPSHLVDHYTCSNIVRQLRVIILYANTGSFFSPQPKIVGVKFSFSIPSELKLHCNKRYCQESSGQMKQRISIESSVEFIDISSGAVATFLEPPKINLALPGDFFYPFTSSAVNHRNCNLLLMCTIAAIVANVYKAIFSS